MTSQNTTAPIAPITKTETEVLAALAEPVAADTENGSTPANAAVLRGLINQSAKEMKVCTPWTFKADIPPHLQGDRTAFKKWCSDNSTQHLFFCASQGVCADLRVSKNNPLKFLHGLIADYDCEITDAMEESVLKNVPADLQPNWISRTFSGGRRLVWLFADPIPLDCPGLVKPFLKLAAAEFKVSGLLPGWDEPAWKDLAKTYEVGRDWRPIAPSPLPTHRLHHMLFRASDKVEWNSKTNGTAIPLDVVAEEVEKLYPGTCNGSFEAGVRVPVFWDGGENPSSCIVQENGCVCFSRDKVFYTWREILGHAFVAKFEDDKIGGAVEGAWFDGKTYYRKINGRWMHTAKDDFVKWLCVNKGLDNTRGKNERASETMRAEVFVQTRKRVDGLIPCVFDERDIIEINGSRFLNSAGVKPIQPAREPQTWGENFPWLAEFLDTCWDEALVPCVVEGKPPQKARDIFLAWLKRAYVPALGYNPQKGHALFLVGKIGIGKTLLGTRIIADAMGGGCEATDYLLSSSDFNKELLHVGVWNIDDGSVNADQRAHQKFSDMIKRVVANPGMSYHAKFHDKLKVEWCGRVVTTLNDDESSLGVIPDIDTGLQDKIIVLKFADAAREFPTSTKLETTIGAEMPYLLRWLVDWMVPAEIRGQSRFGINAYIHEKTRTDAMYSGGGRDLLEAIEVWKRRGAQEETMEYWSGTAADWLALTAYDEGLRHLTKGFTTRSVGKKFTQASKTPGSGIEVAQISDKHGNRYCIDVRPAKPSNP